ncbi:hypothetical protein BRARA_A03504 [Brassica rapa]|uniref:Transcription initiation factor TFIID subunit 12 domain-containing protein n=1 Tax=Brassica campestris TaxID=3711 RepID=A0A398AZ84_BRACM|nr:hypothetical protein BRARA_A03504 [Brassica rapa]
MDQPRQISPASQPPETPSQASKPAVLSQIQQPASTNPSSSSASPTPSSPTPPSPSLSPNPNPSPIGVPPSPIPSPSQPPPSVFPGSFGQQYGGLMRPSSIGSPGVQSNGAAQQSLHATNQPWLSCSAQGKQPLAPPSYRPLVNKTSMQPISHVPQQHLSTSPATSQPQQQHQSEGQLQQKPLPHPHQPARVQGPVSQKGTSPAMLTQPPVSQPGNQAKTVSSENEVSDNRILGKRNIHELLQQVEATLADIAEDFLESITTFGCSLAKHRKSDTLRTSCSMLVKRNWNIRPPGFSSDEIKAFRKPLTTDIHKERLAAIKKSVTVMEAGNARNPYGHGMANARGGQAKTPANPLGSTTFNH